MTKAKAIGQADVVRHLSADELRALPGLLGRVAPAMVAAHGFYTYVDTATGQKICLVAR